MSIGVVIGRFQVAELHEGHKFLLQYVQGRHDKLLVLIGCSPGMPTQQNPLTYEIRKYLIQEYFPDAYIERLWDKPHDELWSQQVDEILESYEPEEDIVLYGSRDSFLEHYKGRYECEFIPPVDSPSGTHTRSTITQMHTREFREGIIYSQFNRLPISYPVVDVAIYNPSDSKFLMGRKIIDKGNECRFVGGFVDTRDASLEDAAMREVGEETGHIEVTRPVYLGTCRIQDYRYRNSSDSILSAVFLVNYLYGKPIPSDDMGDLNWLTMDQIRDTIAFTHLPILHLLEEHFRGYFE